MSLTILPAEMLEAILICTAIAGHPRAISAFAQTCRANRALVYDATDSHLWREIYLATFDDPRALRFVDLADFDWAKCFQQYIWAESYMRSPTRPLHVKMIHKSRHSNQTIMLTDISSVSEDGVIIQRALEAFISAVALGAPLPSPVQQPDALALTHTKPLTKVWLRTPTAPPAISSERRSLNISWVEAALARGYPAALTAKLVGLRANNAWDEEPTAQALARLVSYTGFLPAAALEEPTASTVPTTVSPPRRSTRLASASTAQDGAHPRVLELTADMQRARARVRARERVYHLNYLLRRRHWGPYRPVPPTPPPSASAGAPERAAGSDSDTSDEDFVPVVWDSGPEAESADDTESESELAPVPARHRPRKRTVPGPAQLHPDWMWLAAARVVVEANLREKGELDAAGLAALCTLEGLREGAWAPVQAAADEAGCGSTQEGKGKGREEERGDEEDGWDWAGAEGVWRRCVCWLDYNDLIHYNIHGGFDDENLTEAMIIVPVRLRIVGYGPPAIAAYPDRPTIKLEGDIGGAHWMGADDGDDDVRRMHGTVEMIVDGSVRWCLYSGSLQDGAENEWVSEGVQLGGVGSAMGILGMWTGAEHDNADPLGPFWSWKVA